MSAVRRLFSFAVVRQIIAYGIVFLSHYCYKYNKYTKHNSIPTKHLKIMFFDKFIRNLITKTDTANATAIPRTRASSSALVKSNPNFNSLKALAPSIVGTARKKVNSAAATRETPMSKAPIIVAPDRDVPGI